jgi:hypothetical protein
MTGTKNHVKIKTTGPEAAFSSLGEGGDEVEWEGNAEYEFIWEGGTG